MRHGAAFLLPLAVTAVAREDAWAAISQHIPSCALPCLAETQLKSTCLPTDTACACELVLASPLMTGCAASCNAIGDTFSTINGTATACNVPMRDRGAVLYIATTVLCSIALLSILLRLLSTPVTTQKSWVNVADDWYMMANAVLLVGLMSCTILIYENKYGRDIWTLKKGQIRRVMILLYNLEIYYSLVNMLTKLSILGFYLRFFPFTVFPRLRTAIYITMAVTAASGISFTMTMVFQCTPISLFWRGFDDRPPAGSCININAYAWTVAIFNFALDIWLLALPMPELLKLSLPPRKKIVVCLMFAVGGFVTIVSVPRIMSMASFKSTINPTYDLVDVSLWGHVEASVCVILACIPRISILFMRLYRMHDSRRRDMMEEDFDPSSDASAGHRSSTALVSV
ncbi:hypothetical protein QBC42DRAFT_265459 [Cladorrhinum samala]|uniref:Extracellular membrane protein CFEM domain-containing protein n=1 Tax=Cladorrhinum samala TaxID=585594 RepID=A0AAV9HRP4_9PEZI|nr:hypothetical protein QBC42DRAFT_265459 [Cladorrhinum samala]